MSGSPSLRNKRQQHHNNSNNYNNTINITNNNSGSPGKDWLSIFSAYRIRFSCKYTGKFVASTKRKVSWKFGFSNPDAIREGKTGRDCLGEEHEVQLIWSVKSGRAQIIYNNRDITHLGKFVPQQQSQPNNSDVLSGSERASPTQLVQGAVNKLKSKAPFQVPKLYRSRSNGSDVSSGDSVNSRASRASNKSTRSNGSTSSSLFASVEYLEFVWRGPNNKMMRIVVHTNPPEEGNQYDLFIESRSFFGLPTAHELGNREYACTHRRNLSNVSNTSSIPHSDVYRSLSASTKASVAPRDSDELEGNYNTGVEDSLELLRDDVAASVPGTQQMMSRAIINAFTEGDRDLKKDTFSKGRKVNDAIGIETDAIHDAYEWMKFNGQSGAHNAHTQKLSFMQNQINTMVLNVRRGIISPPAASTSIHSVAAVLGLELATPLPKNTVVFIGLKRDISRNDLRAALEVYGKIDGVAVASGNKGFGFIRFKASAAVRRVSDASFRNQIIILDVSPQVYSLEDLPNIHSPQSRVSSSRKYVSNSNQASPVPPSKHQSHFQFQREIPIEDDNFPRRTSSNRHDSYGSRHHVDNDYIIRRNAGRNDSYGSRNNSVDEGVPQQTSADRGSSHGSRNQNIPVDADEYISNRGMIRNSFTPGQHQRYRDALEDELARYNTRGSSRTDMPSNRKFQQAIDEDLRHKNYESWNSKASGLSNHSSQYHQYPSYDNDYITQQQRAVPRYDQYHHQYNDERAYQHGSLRSSSSRQHHITAAQARFHPNSNIRNDYGGLSRDRGSRPQDDPSYYLNKNSFKFEI